MLIGNKPKYLDASYDLSQNLAKMSIQPVESLNGTDKFLKVPRSGTFKNLSRSYDSAKRCSYIIEI
jgi:hypothetical protein